MYGKRRKRGLICTTSSGRYNRCDIDHQAVYDARSASRDFEFVQSANTGRPNDDLVLSNHPLTTMDGAIRISNVPSMASIRDYRQKRRNSDDGKKPGEEKIREPFNLARSRGTEDFLRSRGH